jgi:hypothetical protein
VFTDRQIETRALFSFSAHHGFDFMKSGDLQRVAGDRNITIQLGPIMDVDDCPQLTKNRYGGWTLVLQPLISLQKMKTDIAVMLFFHFLDEEGLISMKPASFIGPEQISPRMLSVARRFAALLLMPPEPFRKQAQHSDRNHIALYFGVDQDLVELRSRMKL